MNGKRYTYYEHDPSAMLNETIEKLRAQRDEARRVARRLYRDLLEALRKLDERERQLAAVKRWIDSDDLVVNADIEAVWQRLEAISKPADTD